MPLLGSSCVPGEDFASRGALAVITDVGFSMSSAIGRGNVTLDKVFVFGDHSAPRCTRRGLLLLFWAFTLRGLSDRIEVSSTCELISTCRFDSCVTILLLVSKACEHTESLHTRVDLHLEVYHSLRRDACRSCRVLEWPIWALTRLVARDVETSSIMFSWQLQRKPDHHECSDFFESTY